MRLLNRFFGPLTQDQFAKMILRRLRRAGIKGKLVYDPREFWIRETEGMQFFLANAYAEDCRAAKADRELILKRFIASWASSHVQAPEDFEDAKPDLMPVVRARSYYEVDLRRVAPEGTVALHAYQIIADHLCVSLVYDLPAAMLTITQELLDKWGVTLYEALETGKANLKETTKSYAQIGSIYAVVNGDSYDASRLVLTDLIAGMEVLGDTIAMIPNRETLLVAGAGDHQGLDAMLNLAEEGLKHERYISGIALRLVDGDWEQWLPPEDHPLFDRFDRLRMHTIGQEYESQKGMLEAELQREGRDVFVASYSAMEQKSTGRISTYSVRGKDVPMLLPRTDLIMLVGPAGDDQAATLASGRWEDVERVAGHLMEPQGLYPERYLVEIFPAVEQLRRIGIVYLD